MLFSACGLLCNALPMPLLLTAELHEVTPALAVQVEYFVSSNFGEQMYNSCKVHTVWTQSRRGSHEIYDVDCARRLFTHVHAVLQQDVVYPVMSQRAMTFVGGGARNFTEWFAFLGLVKVCAAPGGSCVKAMIGGPR